MQNNGHIKKTELPFFGWRILFSRSFVRLCNSLPQKVVEAGILNIFKPEVDRFLLGSRIKGYQGEIGMWKSKHKQISHDFSEWRGRLVGLNGLLLLLFPLFMCMQLIVSFP